MLLTINDFQGEYRLHNTNNPDPDLLLAIDGAQRELAHELFEKGAALVINNLPTAPPNLGLRQLYGFIDLFASFTFSHIQLGVLGAGAKKTSEHPGQNAMATRNFYMPFHYFRYAARSFLPYETPRQAQATAADTLTLPAPDPILPLLLAAGFEVAVQGVGNLTLAAVTPTTLTFTTAPPFNIGQNYSFVQNELRLRKKYIFI